MFTLQNKNWYWNSVLKVCNAGTKSVIWAKIPFRNFWTMAIAPWRFAPLAPLDSNSIPVLVVDRLGANLVVVVGCDCCLAGIAGIYDRGYKLWLDGQCHNAVTTKSDLNNDCKICSRSFWKKIKNLCNNFFQNTNSNCHLLIEYK